MKGHGDDTSLSLPCLCSRVCASERARLSPLCVHTELCSQSPVCHERMRTLVRTPVTTPACCMCANEERSKIPTRILLSAHTRAHCCFSTHTHACAHPSQNLVSKNLETETEVAPLEQLPSITKSIQNTRLGQEADMCVCLCARFRGGGGGKNF